MGKIVMRKQGRGLYAEDRAALEALEGIKDGRDVVVMVKKARNPKHTRLFEVLVSKVADSGAWDYDRESLRDWLKLRVGHVYKYYVGDKLVVRSKSLSEESMGQAEFKAFFDRAIWYMANEILGDEEWENLRREVLESTIDRRLESYERMRR